MARSGSPHLASLRLAATMLLLVVAGVGLMVVGLLVPGDETSQTLVSTREAANEGMSESEALAAVAGGAVDARTDANAPSATPASRYAFAWPTDGGITQGRSVTHGGIDVAAGLRDPITAVRDGEVRFAGGDPCCVYGYYVIVDHDDGWSTLYGHLNEISVKAGDRVAQGDVIGLAGDTGRSDGVHVHLELRTNGRAVNPLSYLEPTRYYVPALVEAEADQSTPTPEPLPQDRAIDRAVRWMEGSAGDYAVQRASCFAIAAGPNWSVSCSATQLGCQGDVCDVILEACVVGLLVETACTGY